MKKSLKITVNGKDYPVKFGYGCFRILSAVWNCSVAEIFNRLGNMEGYEIERFVDILYCALSAANPDVEFNSDDVGDWLLKNSDKMEDISAALQDSFPQEKEQSGKPEAVEVNEPQELSPKNP